MGFLGLCQVLSLEHLGMRILAEGQKSTSVHFWSLVCISFLESVVSSCFVFPQQSECSTNYHKVFFSPLRENNVDLSSQFFPQFFKTFGSLCIQLFYHMAEVLPRCSQFPLTVNFLGSFMLFIYFFHTTPLFLKFLLKLLTFTFFFLLLAEPRGMWDLSSPTRDRTQAPCSGSVES